MEDESQIHAPFPDNQSFGSRFSSNRSFDRMSERHSNRSLTAKPSMIEVLDLEYPIRSKNSTARLSQFDDDSQSRLLRFSGSSSKDIDSNPLAEEKYQMFDQIPNFIQNQIPYSRHECLCLKQACSMQGCPCTFAVNELCVVGLCCSVCIQKKNNSFTNEIGKFSFESKQKKSLESKQKRQNNHIKPIKKGKNAKVQKDKYDFVYCTCKKTQCVKKYCPCFALNKKCNECCICEDCHNHTDEEETPQKGMDEEVQKLNSQKQNYHAENLNPQEMIIDMMIQQNIDEYFEDSPENYDNVELNKAMDFDPVDFSEFTK